MKPLSKEFLLSRGFCCKNGCLNCPYEYNKNKNMDIENKYYVPDTSDFREGFEYEQLYNTYSPPDFKLTSSKWIKQVFDDFTSEENYLFNRKLSDNSIRVPYLTKENIVSKGWSLTKEPNETEFTCQKIISDKYFYEVNYDTYLKELTVESWYQSKLGGNPELYNSYTIYKGTCRCINDFRLIMKLLNIKIKI